VMLAIERPVVGWFRKRTLWQQIGIALAAALIYLGVYGGILAALAPTPDPVEWEQNAAAVIAPEPGETATDPRSLEDGLTIAGMILGFGLAFALGTHRPTGFDAKGPILKRLLRFGVGVVGVAILWLGIKLLTPDDPLALTAVLRFVRYTTVIFWVMYAAPWTFVKLKL